ncbi:head decoration protein [Methylobacterium oryzihabitans]|uniref:Head decoration protein n=1 Tax=Methylobacterium oryzihabitans TaxID=2499852 RepID=A0A3S2VHG6_9HYPH|nr:head decoration protein [Methylobacterium oryzihabitans]RVU13157.1 head decoration protein [Methylobacterium oryzihabitans]
MDYGTFDPTSLIVGDCPKHRPMTIAAGNAYPRGTVLGRITATDKYVRSVRTANDGSQAPVAVLAADVDATAADTMAPAYDDGQFAAELLGLDASWTVVQLQAAWRQAGSRLYARSVGQNG